MFCFRSGPDTSWIYPHFGFAGVPIAACDNSISGYLLPSGRIGNCA